MTGKTHRLSRLAFLAVFGLALLEIPYAGFWCLALIRFALDLPTHPAIDTVIARATLFHWFLQFGLTALVCLQAYLLWKRALSAEINAAVIVVCFGLNLALLANLTEFTAPTPWINLGLWLAAFGLTAGMATTGYLRADAGPLSRRLATTLRNLAAPSHR